MKWYDSIKVKLLGFFIVISIVFLSAMIITFYFIRENNLQQNATTATTLATTDILNYIQNTQIKAEEIVLTLASVAKEEFGNKTIEQAVISSILSTDKQNSINIVSGGTWFEPYALHKDKKDYMLFFNRNKQKEFSLIKGYNAINYRDMKFYTLATETDNNTAAWTNVYIDPVTHISMITVVSPIYKNNTFIGVATLDIKINGHTKSWNSINSQNMYLMMTDKKGNIIGKSKNLNEHMNKTNIYELNQSGLSKIIQQIKPVLTHNIKDEYNNSNVLSKIFFIENDPVFLAKSVIAVYHFKDTHWNIIIGIPKDKVLTQSNQTFKTVLTVIVILTLIATILGYILLQKLFAAPIESINDQIKENLLQDGQQYKLLTCKDKGEIGLLVENLNSRSITLKETQAREAKEIKKRLDSEKILLQQSKMAAMGEMMDAVAHQWKQPLNALSMYSDIIKSDFKDGLVDQKYIEQFKDDMQVQIDHMVDTLDEFRTFFRSNKEDEMFSLLSIIHSVLFLTKDDLLRHRITINIEQKDHIDIDGSSNEFKHLILNIINNAKDAFNDNKIEKRKITIRLINDDKGKRIEIEDNAGGIPEHIIADIFKANVTSKEEGKGTGIGLYMSTQIATKHSAILSVKNQNDGACFTVTFA